MKSFCRPAVAAVLLFLSHESEASDFDTTQAQRTDLQHDEYLQSQFFLWTREHGKMYTSEEEAELRLGIWKENHGKFESISSVG